MKGLKENGLWLVIPSLPVNLYSASTHEHNPIVGNNTSQNLPSSFVLTHRISLLNNGKYTP